MAFVLSFLTWSFSLEFWIVCACNYSILGLEDNITLQTSSWIYDLNVSITRHENGTYNIVQDKHIFLKEASQNFIIDNDFLKTKQCLTAGITEELEVAIEGEDTCNPEYVTISVEPTIPIIKQYPDSVHVGVDTCTSDHKVNVTSFSFENRGICIQFNCSIECNKCQSETFWSVDVIHSKSPLAIPDKLIYTSSNHINLDFTYNLRVTCADSRADMFWPDHVAVFQFYLTFERNDTCTTTISTNPTSTQLITTSATALNTATLTRRTITTTDNFSAHSGPPTTWLRTATQMTSAVTVSMQTTGSFSNVNIIHDEFLDKPVNVAVVSAVGGVVLLGVIVGLLYVWCSGCSKVTPVGSSGHQERESKA